MARQTSGTQQARLMVCVHRLHLRSERPLAKSGQLEAQASQQGAGGSDRRSPPHLSQPEPRILSGRASHRALSGSWREYPEQTLLQPLPRGGTPSWDLAADSASDRKARPCWGPGEAQRFNQHAFLKSFSFPGALLFVQHRGEKNYLRESEFFIF